MSGRETYAPWMRRKPISEPEPQEKEKEERVINFDEIERDIRKIEGGFDYYASELVGALIQIRDVDIREDGNYAIAFVDAEILDVGNTGLEKPDEPVKIRFSGKAVLKQLKLVKRKTDEGYRVNAYIALRETRDGSRKYIVLSSRP